MLCLHGTSGNNIDNILYNGLLANPPRKVWEGESESYYGVYFTFDWVRACVSAEAARSHLCSDSGAIVICDIKLEDDRIRLDEDWLGTYILEGLIDIKVGELHVVPQGRDKIDRILYKHRDIVRKVHGIKKSLCFRYCGDVLFDGINKIVSIVQFGYDGIKWVYDNDEYSEMEFKRLGILRLQNWVKNRFQKTKINA